MTNITDNNNNGPNGGNTSVYGNNNSVSGASNNGYSSLPSRKYSYGGSEHLAASRAAAGKYQHILLFYDISVLVLFYYVMLEIPPKVFATLTIHL